MLLIAPPEDAIVRPEIEIVVLFVLARNTPEGDEPIVNEFAPGPMIERLTPIVICPLVKVMFVTPGSNWIIYPLGASLTACRNEPGPLSFPFVTVTVFGRTWGVGRGLGVGVALGVSNRNTQVKSTGGPQSKAPAAICIVLTPGTTGDVLKMKAIVVFPFITAAESAGIPFTVRSLGWTLLGSTGSFRLI